MSVESQNVYLTASLSGKFNEVEKWPDKEQANSFFKMVGLTLEKHIQTLRKMKSGPKRAKALHKFLDESNQEYMQKLPKIKDEISCRKGCSFCCHSLPIVNEDEAKLLAQRAKGLDLDMELLKRQSEWQSSTGNIERDWFIGLSPDENRCVFLKDGECQVYEDRPATCRNYFVLNDPQNCSYEDTNPTKQAFFLDPQVATSASFNLQKAGREVGSFATYLPLMMAKYLLPNGGSNDKTN